MFSVFREIPDRPGKRGILCERLLDTNDHQAAVNHMMAASRASEGRMAWVEQDGTVDNRFHRELHPKVEA